MDREMFRRTVGFAATVVVAGVVMYQLAWHQDVLDSLGGVGFFVLFAAFLVVLGVLFVGNEFTKVRVTLALVLGAVAATKGSEVIDHITWKGVGYLSLATAVLFVLWLATCADREWFNHYVRTPISRWASRTP